MEDSAIRTARPRRHVDPAHRRLPNRAHHRRRRAGSRRKPVHRHNLAWRPSHRHRRLPRVTSTNTDSDCTLSHQLPHTPSRRRTRGTGSAPPTQTPTYPALPAAPSRYQAQGSRCAPQSRTASRPLTRSGCPSEALPVCSMVSEKHESGTSGHKPRWSCWPQTPQLAATPSTQAAAMAQSLHVRLSHISSQT